MNVERLLGLLRGVRQNGKGWSAQCPAHDDKNPSLSIAVSEGRILMHCFAGCSLETICSSIGIAQHELFLKETQPSISATYEYTDEHGVLVFQVLRSKRKTFRQRRPDGKGGWIWNLKQTGRVLYRLPELLKAESVVVVEGEKDCETARKIGLVATCNPGGAGKWREEYSESLRGKHVAIIADGDEPGRRHAQQVAASLCGKVASLKILELPRAKDLTEWVEHGGSRKTILDLFDSCAEWNAARDFGPPGVVLRRYADIAPESLRWLWRNRIPLGKLSMLIGDPGLGKSLLTIDCAARLTQGLAFPDGAPCEPGSAIFLSAEDEPADTIRPRLDAAGADVSRVYSLEAVRVRLSDGTCAEKTFNLETDIAQLEDVLRRFPGIRLIVIDPISAYLGGVNSDRNAEVRGLLTPLAALAARHAVAILGVSHFRKSDGPAVHRAISSIAFVAASRAVWGIAIHPDDPSRRVMLPIKQNLAPDVSGLSFGIELNNGIPRLSWGGAIRSMDPNIILGSAENREEHGRLHDAQQWLSDLLAEGAVSVKEIKRQATGAGHYWPTIERAKSKLGAKAEKSGFGTGASWAWKLSHEDDQTVHTNLTAFDQAAENKGNNGNPQCEDHQSRAFPQSLGWPPPQPVPCTICGKMLPSALALSRHLDSCGKGDGL